MDTDTFVKTINDLRLANKDKWYFWQGEVNGAAVQIKGFNTTLQIFSVNGLKANTVMDATVAKFKECLRTNVTPAQPLDAADYASRYDRWKETT